MEAFKKIHKADELLANYVGLVEILIKALRFLMGPMFIWILPTLILTKVNFLNFCFDVFLGVEYRPAEDYFKL